MSTVWPGCLLGVLYPRLVGEDAGLPRFGGIARERLTNSSAVGQPQPLPKVLQNLCQRSGTSGAGGQKPVEPALP